MNDAMPDERPWKRIARLTLWLCLVPPVGLWKLREDKTLSGAAKWRILVYLLLLPALLYATITIWMTNSTLQRLLP
jgi:uncharacterized membrane protein YsdA (DUF1294 family)